MICVLLVPMGIALVDTVISLLLLVRKERSPKLFPLALLSASTGAIFVVVSWLLMDESWKDWSAVMFAIVASAGVLHLFSFTLALEAALCY